MPYVSQLRPSDMRYDFSGGTLPGKRIRLKSKEITLSEFEKFRGTQFDPNIDDVFLDILKNHYDEIEEIRNKYMTE